MSVDVRVIHCRTMSTGDREVVLRALRELSRQLPDAEEYVMVHHPAFRVGKKPYAVVGLRADSSHVTLSINLGPTVQAHLLEDERFSKTPYIGQHGWVSVNFDDVSAPELQALVVDSYRRCAGRKQLARLDAAGASTLTRGAADGGAVGAVGIGAGKVAADAVWKQLGLAAPARRALVRAGLVELGDLGSITEEAVRGLHGMGPSALKLLQVAMAKKKLRFARAPR
jgi:hypothetical protein